eukprot:COSAG01_NODE_12842_length_1677_cov_3.245247_1_plen_294_part_00
MADEPLYDEAALAGAVREGAEHLEHLRAEGVLNGTRKLRFTVVPFRPGDGSSAEPGGKVLHLIRHGQGFHNLLGDVYRSHGVEFSSTGADLTDNNPYRRPELVDPPLTAIGRKQASALRARTQLLSPQLVVVSPMVRATQTALLGWAHLVEGATTTVPFVAHEGAREPGGVHTCDQRRPLSELQKEFPMIDYSLVEPLGEEDPLWHDTQRESTTEVCDRGYALLEWLHARPETDIALSSHSSILFTLLNAVMTPETPGKGLAQWFLTGEMRSVQLHVEEVDCATASEAADDIC